jgi:hypothetical protein
MAPGCIKDFGLLSIPHTCSQNHHAYRIDKSAPLSNHFGKWLYVTAVLRGQHDIDVYVNGDNIGGDYYGSSDSPMSSNYPDATAKIGYWYSNGTVTRYKGLMDELKIWNAALTTDEIKRAMHGKLDDENYNLIGFWDFDEVAGDIVKDKSKNKFDGTLMGGVQRVRRR